jgi:hypothetical protein
MDFNDDDRHSLADLTMTVVIPESPSQFEIHEKVYNLSIKYPV